MNNRTRENDLIKEEYNAKLRLNFYRMIIIYITLWLLLCLLQTSALPPTVKAIPDNTDKDVESVLDSDTVSESSFYETETDFSVEISEETEKDPLEETDAVTEKASEEKTKGVITDNEPETDIVTSKETDSIKETTTVTTTAVTEKETTSSPWVPSQETTNTTIPVVTIPEETTDPYTEKETPIPYTEPETTQEPIVTPPVTPPPTPVVCKNHSYVFDHRDISDSYQLYTFVIDTYVCSVCGEKCTESKSVANNSSISAVESEIVGYVNNLRASLGLNTLWCNNNTFNSFAKTRAYEISNCFGHMRPDGSDASTTDGTYYVILENINAGGYDSQSIFNAFKNSNPHYRAMIFDEAVGIAVGVYITEDGTAYTEMSIIAAY